MVDFNEELSDLETDAPIDPCEIYETLDRASDKGPLRTAQEKVLEIWHSNHRADRDVIVKLHTGQGKTLIGLLMLQSLLNEKKGPALYLCPDNLLIDQTKEQAKQFGIKVCDEREDIPDDFISGDKIFVTSVQKLFNGLTKFGLNSKSLKIASILMDDAHACADSIRDACSIKIPRAEPAYSELFSLFSHHLTHQGKGTFADIENKRFGAFLPVPYWAWMDSCEEVAKILSRHQDKKSIKFTWPILKDKLEHCQCIVSGDSIAIEPFVAPLDIFGTYWKAKHRIFMSATVTDDAFLVKGLSLSTDSINSPLTYEKEKWSGEKMILVPSLTHETLDRNEIVKYFSKKWPASEFGRIGLVNSFKNSKDWEAYGSKIADAETIKNALDTLRKGSYEDALVLVNRYDGIDLPDASCRILIFDGRPHSQNLIDLYEEHCRPESDATLMRTVRTIEQGLGRCVRGEKDYAAAVLIGPELIRLVRDRHSRNYLSSQVSTQIEIGIGISEMASKDVKNVSPLQAFVDLLNKSINRDSGWKKYYTTKMSTVKESGANQKLLNSYNVELQAELLFISGKYSEASAILQGMIDGGNLDAEDKGWYLQTMARYHYARARSKSNTYQLAAHRTNPMLLAPESGVTVSKLLITSQGRIERIKDWIASFESYEQLNINLREILDNLTFGKAADKFENALDKLSISLGFKGERPDKIWKEGPDNLWAINDTDYFLWECKNDALPNKAAIDKRESDQMNRSCSWFSKHYPGCKSVNVIVHPSNKVESAGAFRVPVLSMKSNHLNNFKRDISDFFKSFENQDFKDISLEYIERAITSYHLSANEIITTYTSSIKDLK
ncbi:DEAD/DEAH box helicase [Pseudomonas syringae]|uniref:DEAD/DEAH box helicase n=1 Tax=Pseudomonas syringae TaxID=317 RepID=A0A085UZM8_PSESX|nr:DEAD/DEAH box helicase family protein [Pseudomonas syringae]KFE48641.1 DEAD/DEAH box helicase [Pseudomonas syringae]